MKRLFILALLAILLLSGCRQGYQLPYEIITANISVNNTALHNSGYINWEFPTPSNSTYIVDEWFNGWSVGNVYGLNGENSTVKIWGDNIVIEYSGDNVTLIDKRQSKVK